MATVVIAEAGVNHNGNIQIAFDLIEAAAQAGADAVKFQTFKAKELAIQNAPKADYQKKLDISENQHEMLSRLELNRAQHKQLSECCRNCGIEFLSTAFGVPHLEMLLKIGMKAIKVPSGEITHLPLLQKMAHHAKRNGFPVYMSTGMSNLSEVETALQIFLDKGIKRTDITLMHCLSSYPAPTDEVNLKAIQTLANALHCPVGYSDHTTGISAAVAAVALGASVIEKHITLDCSLPGPDHQSSLEPQNFKTMVNAIRETEKLLGDGIKKAQSSEINTRSVARRSIRASRDLSIGEIMQEKDLICQRPGDGLSPMMLPLLLGQPVNRNYKKGDCIFIPNHG